MVVATGCSMALPFLCEVLEAILTSIFRMARLPPPCLHEICRRFYGSTKITYEENVDFQNDDDTTVSRLLQ
jgi:hypothetical protein